MKEAYVSDDDLFNTDSVRNARAVDDSLREIAPVVRLARDHGDIFAR